MSNPLESYPKVIMSQVDRVCIIDDDPIFVYGTKRIIAEMNFCDDIIVFENGQDAIDGFITMSEHKEDLPAIVFLDLNMPIMNGWDFLEDFVKIPNQNRKKVVIYIISSSIDPRDLERIKNYKVVNNYILKPLSEDDLKKCAKKFDLSNLFKYVFVLIHLST